MVAKILISPNLEVRRKEIAKILSINLEGCCTNHQDVLYMADGVKLGVGESKQIKDHFAYKPNKAKGKVVVLESADNLTSEAQNALLKTIEELPEEAIFLLGATSQNNFLPTILSRCQIIHLSLSSRAKSKDLPSSEDPHVAHASGGASQDDTFKKQVEKLLNSDIQTRFEYIEKLKDREEFLKALIQYFNQDLVRSDLARSDLERLKDFLQELLEAEKWAESNVSIRAILEYLMLIMPSK